jgi:ribosomal protein S18 acetylase RimI-like enzyme
MTPEVLAQLMEATWPPARAWREGVFTLRDGDGGGKRVSAASCEDDFAAQDLERLEASTAEPLVLIRAGEEALDQALADRGWRVVDPVVAYVAPVSALVADLPPLAAFAHWPPLQIAASIWEEGGISPARIKVMERVAGAKSVVLARSGDRPAGAAFVAAHGDHAMLHALEVRPHLRRKGVGEVVLRAAANWAAAQGAQQLGLVVTQRNAAARALYDRLGMAVVGQYHYRMK